MDYEPRDQPEGRPALAQGVSEARPAPLPEAEEAPSLRKRLLNIRTAISFAVAFSIIYFLIRGIDIDPQVTWEKMRGADLLFYGLSFVVYYSGFSLRGVRWRLLLANVGFSREKGVAMPSSLNLGRMILLSWFANCIVPAKLGDAWRAYMVKERTGVSFSKTIGTVLAERIVDILVVVVMLALAAVWAVRGRGAEVGVGIVEIGAAMVAVLVISLVVMWRFGVHIERILPGRVRHLYRLFQDGTLSSFRQLPAVVLLSVAIWLTESGRLYLISHSLGLELGLAMIIFAALANSLLTALPFTPGGLGLVEAGLIGVLAIVLSKEDAVSVAILDRTVSYWSVILFGFLLYLVTRKR